MSPPLRFLALVGLLWTGLRGAMIWPADEAPQALPVPSVPRAPTPSFTATAPAEAPPGEELALEGGRAGDPEVDRRGAVARTLLSQSSGPVAERSPASLAVSTPPAAPGAPAPATVSPASFADKAMPTPSAPAPAPLPAAPASGGWRADVFVFTRAGGGRGLAPGAQLGGSQAFARIARTVAPGLDITARASAALRDPGREAALGLAWRPAATMPVTVTIERRIALDSGGRAAWAAFAAGGVDAVRMTRGLRLDAYAQAGMVGARSRDGFVDGAARIGREMGPLTIGAGAWGAAQPGVARLDLGPQLAYRRRAGRIGLTAMLDGRLRVAGDARPAHGVTLTLAAGF